MAKVPLLRMEIVKRSDDVKGFVVLPRRWVVKRRFGRNRDSPKTSGASPKPWRIMVEILPPEFAREYLAFTRPDKVTAAMQAAATAAGRHARGTVPA